MLNRFLHICFDKEGGSGGKASDPEPKKKTDPVEGEGDPEGEKKEPVEKTVPQSEVNDIAAAARKEGEESGKKAAEGKAEDARKEAEKSKLKADSEFEALFNTADAELTETKNKLTESGTENERLTNELKEATGKLATFEEALSTELTARLEGVPEHVIALMDTAGLDPVQKMAYLTEHAEEIGVGKKSGTPGKGGHTPRSKRGDNGGPPAPSATGRRNKNNVKPRY